MTSHDVFISYGRGDERIAEALERNLRMFARRWFRRSRITVFRDSNSLPVSSELEATLRSSLDRSRYLVLLASPASASSAWVGFELDHWLQLGRRDRILPILCAGAWIVAGDNIDSTAASAVPPALLGVLDQPRYLDMRWAGATTDLTMGNPLFYDAVGDLAATVLGRPKHEVIGEEVAVRRRRRRIVAVSALTLVTALGASVVAATNASRSQQRAERSDRVARSRALARQARGRDAKTSDVAMLIAAEAIALEPTSEAIAAGIQLLAGRGSVSANLVGDLGNDWRFTDDGAAFGIVDGEVVVVADHGTTSTPTSVTTTGAYVGNDLLDVTPDGSSVLLRSGGSAGPIGVTSARTGKPESAPIASTAYVDAATITPDRAHVLLALETGVIERVASATGAVEDRVSIDGFQDSQSSVEFAADGRSFAVRVDNAAAYYRLADDGEIVDRTVFGEAVGVDGVYELAISPDGALIAAATSDAAQSWVHVIDTSTDQVVDVESLVGSVSGIALTAHHDDDFGVVTSVSDEAGVTSTFAWTRAQRPNWLLTQHQFGSPSISPDGSTVIVGSVVLDLGRRGFVNPMVLDQHEVVADSVVDGTQVVSVATSGVWIGRIGEPARLAVPLVVGRTVDEVLIRTSEGVMAVDPSPTGFRLVDPATGTATERPSAIRPGVFLRTDDGRRVLIGHDQLDLIVVDPLTGTELTRIAADPADPLAVSCCGALDAAGRRFASWTTSGPEVTVTDLSGSTDPVTIVLAANVFVQSAAFLPTDRLLVATLDELLVFGVDGARASPFVLPLPDGFAPSMVAISDDDHVVVVSGDIPAGTTTLMVIEAETGAVVVEPLIVDGLPKSVVRAADGSQVVLTTSRGTFGLPALWNDPTRLIHALCASVPRVMTPQEVQATLGRDAHAHGCRAAEPTAGS